MRTETKTVLSTWYTSTFRGVHALIFQYVPYIVIGLVHEGPANFYREKRRVAFVTSHLFTFLVVLSLICLVTTKILICGNQTIWRLEILLRTIVTALLKNQIQWPLCSKQKISRNGKGIFHNSANDRERWWLLIFCGQSNICFLIMPTQPTLRPTNTHTRTHTHMKRSPTYVASCCFRTSCYKGTLRW